jgi:hypothetical protein
MKRFWKIFCVAYPVSFPVAFLLQRHLEQTGNSDALGTWYTVYGALFLSLPLAVFVVLIFLAVQRLRQTIQN